jgi:hypothetical protein
MAVLTILVLGLIGLAAALVVSTFISWYRLRHIPGLLEASLWKGWRLRHVMSGEMCWKIKEVVDEYGEPFFLFKFLGCPPFYFPEF